jgi:hypothetical protein
MKEEADFVKSNPEAAALSARAASLSGVDRQSLAFDSKVDNLQYLQSKFGTLDDDVPASENSSKKLSKSTKVIKSAPSAAAAAAATTDLTADSRSIQKNSTKHQKSGLQLVDAQDADRANEQGGSAGHHPDSQQATAKISDDAPEQSPHDIIRESGRLFLRNCPSP